MNLRPVGAGLAVFKDELFIDSTGGFAAVVGRNCVLAELEFALIAESFGVLVLFETRLNVDLLADLVRAANRRTSDERTRHQQRRYTLPNFHVRGVGLEPTISPGPWISPPRRLRDHAGRGHLRLRLRCSIPLSYSVHDAHGHPPGSGGSPGSEQDIPECDSDMGNAPQLHPGF